MSYFFCVCCYLHSTEGNGGRKGEQEGGRKGEQEGGMKEERERGIKRKSVCACVCVYVCVHVCVCVKFPSFNPRVGSSSSC